MARRIVRDFVEHRGAGLRQSVGADDQQLELLAFAWWSDGLKAPPGADWRWCPGLGRYVRSLGLQRMASGGMGPSLYVSRASPAGGQGTWVWATFFPPQAVDPKVAGRRWTGSTTWRVTVPSADGGSAKWIQTTRAGRQ